MIKTDYLCVDGTYLAFRSFYGVKPLENNNHLPVNAIYGFFNTLLSLEQLIHWQHLLIFFDCSRSKKRLELLEDYKANRAETPEDFKIQLPYIKQVTTAWGAACIERMDVEADDLIGTWAHFASKNKQNIVILSSDKDLMQCVNPYVHQMIRTPDNWHLLNATGVFEKMQVTPEQIVDYLALVGDSIDHYEGLPGVGPKTAANWLKQYGSLEKILQQKDTIEPKRFRPILEEFESRLLRNQALAKLEINMQFIPDIQKQVQNAFRNVNLLKSLLKELNLNNLLKKLNLVEKPAISQQAEFFF